VTERKREELRESKTERGIQRKREMEEGKERWGGVFLGETESDLGRVTWVEKERET